jgi:hypothetical protein
MVVKSTLMAWIRRCRDRKFRSTRIGSSGCDSERLESGGGDLLGSGSGKFGTTVIDRLESGGGDLLGLGSSKFGTTVDSSRAFLGKATNLDFGRTGGAQALAAFKGVTINQLGVEEKGPLDWVDCNRLGPGNDDGLSSGDIY